MNNDKISRNVGEEYVYWIDSAKAIGIILIIVGHLSYGSSLSWINKLIYSFHVPLFFMLSGIVFHSPNSTLHVYIKNKASRLLIPFLCYAVIELLLSLRMMLWKKEISIDVLCGILYVKGRMNFNDPLWFLIVLFEVYCIAAFLQIWKRSEVTKIIIMLASFTIGWLLFSYKDCIPIMNVFGINRAVICLGFFLVGNLILKLRSNFFLLIASIILWICSALTNSKVSLYAYKLGQYPLFLLSSLSGSIAIIIISQVLLDKQTIIGGLTKHSILFLGTQYYWIYPFRKIAKMIGIDTFPYFEIASIVLTVFYVLMLPKAYEAVKQRYCFASMLNGEVKRAVKLSDIDF